MTGRPTKLTKATQEDILMAIRQGATYEHAALYGGISYDTLNNWRKRGEAEIKRREGSRVKPGSKKWNEEQIFVEFFEAIKKAEGGAAVGWLFKIEQAAADGNWQAAAWKLERRYPEIYGRRVQNIDHTSGGKTWEEIFKQTQEGDGGSNSDTPDADHDPYA